MPEFYRQGDIFLCISHSEGNPLGAFEAGACGLTVISTRVGAMPEFITDRVNGFLIENDNWEQILLDVIDRLKLLSADRDLLKKLKENMLENVLSKWTWKHKINQWNYFFERCILEQKKQLKQLKEKKSKPKIAILTETKWAFGRIFYAVQKHSKKFQIDVYEWTKEFDNPTLANYDLIHATTWDVGRYFETKNPLLKDKIIFSGHGLIDFIKMKFRVFLNIPITEEDVNKFMVDPEIIDWLKIRKLGFSVVSHQLYDKLTLDPYNLDPDGTVYLTQCGVDEEVFFPKKLESNSDSLKVIFPYTNVHTTSYDPKRKYLISEIQKRISDENISVEFIFPDGLLPLNKMREFYLRGDVFLCISHSEGNPLGAFEAGACGLTVISTSVGEMPHFIIDRVNGFLIGNGDPEQILLDVVDRLKLLCSDRDLLKKLKENMLENVLNNWTWKHKIDQWDNFFQSCIDKNE